MLWSGSFASSYLDMAVLARGKRCKNKVDIEIGLSMHRPVQFIQGQPSRCGRCMTTHPLLRSLSRFPHHGSKTQNFCYDEQNRLVWAGNSGTQPAADNGTCGRARCRAAARRSNTCIAPATRINSLGCTPHSRIRL